MKKYFIIVLFILAGTTIVGCGKGTALNVNDFASGPTAQTGKITITGIMAGVSQGDPAVFGIFDKRELKCSTPSCNKFFLPVRYEGKIPVRGDEVLVTGDFVKDARGYLFVADKLKVVKNHKLGGV